MTWPGFPKRLQSALKALCCLALHGADMQAPVIAEKIDVPKAETAKILQLLVWGGFVTSRRGTKGGFQLASAPDKITMGEVIDFFLARHPPEPDENSPVLRALQITMGASQQKFARLTLAEVATFSSSRSSRKSRSARSKKRLVSRARKIPNSSVGKSKVSQAQRRSRSNATNR